MLDPFADLIAAERDRLQITQEELALRLTAAGYEVDYGAVAHWEHGRRRPRVAAFRALESVFGWNAQQRSMAMDALVSSASASSKDAA